MTFNAFACIPLVRLVSHSEHEIWRKVLVLPQVPRLTELVLFEIHKIVVIGLDELSLQESIVLRLGMKNLMDFLVHGVLLDLTKSKIGWVHVPFKLSVLLLARLEAPVGLDVHLFRLLVFRHVLIWTDSVLAGVLIRVCWLSILERRISTHIRQIVVAAQALSQRLLLLGSILSFLEFVDEAGDSWLVPCFHDVPCSFRFLCGLSIDEMGRRQRICGSAVVLLRLSRLSTIVTPARSLKDLRYLATSSGVWGGRYGG